MRNPEDSNDQLGQHCLQALKYYFALFVAANKIPSARYADVNPRLFVKWMADSTRDNTLPPVFTVAAELGISEEMVAVAAAPIEHWDVFSRLWPYVALQTHSNDNPIDTLGVVFLVRFGDGVGAYNMILASQHSHKYPLTDADALQLITTGCSPLAGSICQQGLDNWHDDAKAKGLYVDAPTLEAFSDMVDHGTQSPELKKKLKAVVYFLMSLFPSSETVSKLGE